MTSQAPSDTVLVAAAGFGYEEYQIAEVYARPEGAELQREFNWVAFYRSNQIEQEVAAVEHRIRGVALTQAEVDRRLAEGHLGQRVANAVSNLLSTGHRAHGDVVDLYLLSGPTSPQTIRLDAPIVNDGPRRGTRGGAWTQSIRYVPLSALTAPGITGTQQLDALRDD